MEIISLVLRVTNFLKCRARRFTWITQNRKNLQLQGHLPRAMPCCTAQRSQSARQMLPSGADTGQQCEWGPCNCATVLSTNVINLDNFFNVYDRSLNIRCSKQCSSLPLSRYHDYPQITVEETEASSGVWLRTGFFSNPGRRCLMEPGSPPVTCVLCPWTTFPGDIMSRPPPGCPPRAETASVLARLRGLFPFCLQILI